MIPCKECKYLKLCTINGVAVNDGYNVNCPVNKPQEVELWEPTTVLDYLELVCDISIDYDGYNDVKNLKELIDEMRSYVVKARKLIGRRY